MIEVKLTFETIAEFEAWCVKLLPLPMSRHKPKSENEKVYQREWRDKQKAQITPNRDPVLDAHVLLNPAEQAGSLPPVYAMPEPVVIKDETTIEPRPTVTLAQLAALKERFDPQPKAAHSPVEKPPPPPKPVEKLTRAAALARAAMAAQTAIPAFFDNVHRWASERGIVFDGWDDLPTVNAERQRHSLPLFTRRT